LVADPAIPELGPHEYEAMVTVDVKLTVTEGVLLAQVMLGLGLLNVNVGAFEFGATVTICVAVHPLAPMATNVN
jgi:hypothetical protein